jgi:hypothetical protein
MELKFTQAPLRRDVKPRKPKAPRVGKKEFSYNIVNKELYEKWKLDNPKYKDFTYRQFEEAWVKVAKNLWEVVCTNTDGIRLPYYTGDLEIKYVNSYTPATEKAAIDGVEVAELNWNTNGKLGKIVWSVDHARKFNKCVRLFCFRPFRLFSNRANKALEENPEIFKSNRVGGSNLKNIKSYEQQPKFDKSK